MFWNVFLEETVLNQDESWLGNIEFQYSSMEVFLTIPMLKNMAKKDLNVCTVNGFHLCARANLPKFSVVRR